MRVAVARERAEGERRVAATPETVGKLVALGATVIVEAGAGAGSRLPDALYSAAGAEIASNLDVALSGADVLLAVRRPAAAMLRGMPAGALVIGTMDPYGNEGDIQALGAAGVTAIAMDFMPRITRAQVMDVLSSQANLAGYQAVIDAAAEFGRAFPMMMTAAGTVRPAKAFVMGAGVAGLQAIATARRLGAVVSATDVRPAAKEQVESLGGKFIAVEDEEFRQAETAGGYAKQMSPEYQAKQAALTASHIAKQDIVITTALIPGRPAPRLISRAMVESMAPGAVIVDLAAERGGNVELTVPGQVVEHNGVKLVGYTNWAARIAATASQLYARNLLAFLETLIDKASKALAVNWDDELVKATVLTRGGAVVHPNFLSLAVAPSPAPLAAATPRTEDRVAAGPAPAARTRTRKTPAATAPAAPSGEITVPAMAQTPTPPQPGVEPIHAQERPKPAPRRRAASLPGSDAIHGADAMLPNARPTRAKATRTRKSPTPEDGQ